MSSRVHDSDLPAALQSFVFQDEDLVSSSESLHAGMLCPACGKGKLDYDGLLNLTCPACGFSASGGGGCTW